MPVRIPWAPRGDPYDYRSDIPRLIMEGGRAQAEGHLRSGSIWGNLAQQLAAIPEQMAQRKERDARSKEREQEAELRKQQIKGMQQEAQTRKDVGSAMGGYGSPGFDINAAVSQLPPEARVGALKLYEDLEGTRLRSKKLRDEADEHDAYMVAKGAATIEGLLGTPLEGVGMSLVGNYFSQYFPKEIEQFQQLVQQEPAKLKPLLQHLQGQSARFQKEILEQEKTKAETEKLRAPKVPERETRGLDVQANEALKAGDTEAYERLKRVKKEMGQADDRPYRDPVPVVILTDKGPQLLDRKTGTASAITEGGGKTVAPPQTTDERNRAAATTRARPVLDSIAELSERINTQKGVLAKISGATERAKAQANLSDDVSEYQALVSGFTPLLARMVGHSGVLTEQDVQSVRTMLPQPGDSKNVRDRKMARIYKILGEQSGAAAESKKLGRFTVEVEK